MSTVLPTRDISIARPDRAKPVPVTLNDIAFPPSSVRAEQDQEWAVVRDGESWRRIRLHDYHEVFSVPGLYDLWVYEILQCRSPSEVRLLLQEALREASVDPGDLTLLDLGAGNGCVADEMRKIGFRRMVGLDIVPEAKIAADRDRPGLYCDYGVGDLSDPDRDLELVLGSHTFTALTCVAALGFGDIPPEVFSAAMKRLELGSWVAFTIRSDFVDQKAESPFATLIREMTRGRSIEIIKRKTYVHRTDASGRQILYTAFVARTSANA